MRTEHELISLKPLQKLRARLGTRLVGSLVLAIPMCYLLFLFLWGEGSTVIGINYSD